MEGVPHYFIGSHTLADELTAGQFAREAGSLLEKLFKEHESVILTGGSGMFIDALCEGLNEIPASPEVNEKYRKIHAETGLEYLQQSLREKDPEYYETADIQNPVRVIRALEAMELSGQKMSELQQIAVSKPFFRVIRFVLDHEREVLYDRINRRVDEMIARGLEAEARSVDHLRHLKSLRTVGYSEFFDYFDGKTDYSRAVELIKQNTRRYAKRQLTWFRRHPDAHWVKGGEEAAGRILEIYRRALAGS